jgi:hypothetical protein
MDNANDPITYSFNVLLNVMQQQQGAQGGGGMLGGQR